jgi:hypothetical protein
MAQTRASRLICLDGRIVAEPGDRIIAIHFRNEDLPPVPPGGPDMAWVCRFRDELSRGMRRLAARMASDPALGDVKAVYGLMSLARVGRSAKARRFGAWFGFKPTDKPCPPSLGRRLHDRLEDVWLWGMAWAYNPVCLKHRHLFRSRDEVWISRADFLRRYGAAPEPMPGD